MIRYRMNPDNLRSILKLKWYDKYLSGWKYGAKSVAKQANVHHQREIKNYRFLEHNGSLFWIIFPYFLNTEMKRHTQFELTKYFIPTCQIPSLRNSAIERIITTNSVTMVTKNYSVGLDKWHFMKNIENHWN